MKFLTRMTIFLVIFGAVLPVSLLMADVDFPPAEVGYGPNLLDNGGFEFAIVDDTNWIAHSSTSEGVTVIESVYTPAHSGGYAFRISEENIPSQWEASGIFQRVEDIQPNEAYTLHADVYFESITSVTESVYSTLFTMSISYYDDEGLFVGDRFIDLNYENDDFTTIAITGYSPDRASYAVVSLFLKARVAEGGGNVYVDNVVLKKSLEPRPVHPTIMSFGDSITHGNEIVGSYRYRLKELLQEEGLVVDFVGSQLSFEPTNVDEHEGYPSFRADELYNTKMQQVSIYNPDVILLLAGTNDMFDEDQALSAYIDIASILDRIILENPESYVVVASIPTILTPGLDERVTAFNSAVEALVGDYITAGHNVSFVDIYSEILPDAEHMSPDGIHPTALGYEKMAGVWFNAVKPIIEELQLPTPTPSPDPTTDPTPTPDPTPSPTPPINNYVYFAPPVPEDKLTYEETEDGTKLAYETNEQKAINLLNSSSEALEYAIKEDKDFDQLELTISGDVLTLANSKNKPITISYKDFTIQFPPNFVVIDPDDTITFTLDIVADSTDYHLNEQSLLARSPLYNLEIRINGEIISPFLVPIVLTLNAAEAEVSDNSGIYVYDPLAKSWVYVGGELEDGNMTVALEHFSLYALLESTKSFTDIGNHWARLDIEALAAKQIVSGMSESLYNPSGQITRAQFAAMIARALQLKATDSPLPFTDVPIEAWYYNEVKAAFQAGIVSGVRADQFDPNAQITREQMAVLIVKAYLYRSEIQLEQLPKSTILTAYKDADQISPWARSYVEAAAMLELVFGTDGSFMPDQYADRAQSAAMIYRLLK